MTPLDGPLCTQDPAQFKFALGCVLGAALTALVIWFVDTCVVDKKKGRGPWD